MDDGQVAVHAHESHKQSAAVETQLLRGAERETKSESGFTGLIEVWPTFHSSCLMRQLSTDFFTTREKNELTLVIAKLKRSNIVV